MNSILSEQSLYNTQGASVSYLTNQVCSVCRDTPAAAMSLTVGVAWKMQHTSSGRIGWPPRGDPESHVLLNYMGAFQGARLRGVRVRGAHPVRLERSTR